MLVDEHKTSLLRNFKLIHYDSLLHKDSQKCALKVLFLSVVHIGIASISDKASQTIDNSDILSDRNDQQM